MMASACIRKQKAMQQTAHCFESIWHYFFPSLSHSVEVHVKTTSILKREWLDPIVDLHSLHTL